MTTKKNMKISKFICLFLVATFSSHGFCIDDKMIFENIDSQSAIYNKLKQLNSDETGTEQAQKTASSPREQVVILDDMQDAYISPTSEGVMKFEKENVTKRVSKKINQKKAEKLAQEIDDLK